MGKITPPRRSGLDLIYRQIRELYVSQIARWGQSRRRAQASFDRTPSPENRIHPLSQAAVLARFYCIQYIHICMVDRTSSVQITKQMKGVYFSYIAERSTNIHSIAAAAIEALSACFHQDRACPRCFKWSNTHALVKLA